MFEHFYQHYQKNSFEATILVPSMGDLGPMDDYGEITPKKPKLIEKRKTFLTVIKKECASSPV